MGKTSFGPGSKVLNRVDLNREIDGDPRRFQKVVGKLKRTVSAKAVADEHQGGAVACLLLYPIRCLLPLGPLKDLPQIVGDAEVG